MNDICYPAGTDWSCKWTAEQLAEQLEDPVRAAQIERAEAFAWSLLASLTIYRIGVCPITVRPCAARCTPGGSFMTAVVRSGGGGLPVYRIGSFSPYISGGRWYNGCPCTSQDACSCTALSEVILPGTVGSIESIRIDGEVLPSSAYRVDNGNRLVRTDGQQWPVCQDMSSDVDPFEVTYYRGARPNTLTRAAAGALAAEFLASCDGDECRLPGRVTSASRAGESYEFEPTDYPEGKTGIPEVDAVIRIYNPYGLKSEPIVMTPESLKAATRMRTA